KKKKLEKAKKKPPSIMPLALIGGGLGLVVVGGLIFLMVKLFKSDPVVVPTDYASYEAEENAFRIAYPKGWKVDGGGGKNYRWASFKSGGAEVRVREGIEGSLKADIAGAGNADPNAPDERQPFAIVHEDRKNWWADQISGYKEVGAARTVITGRGKARLSE